MPLSRRRKETHAVDAPRHPMRGERFRRYLLGAITALVVARPLVAGEDPGRLLALESVSGLILNFLWLIVALAGAVWLAYSGRPFRLGGWVSVSLVAIVGLMFLATARSDGYRAPGWLIACEWGLIPIIFMLTRELATDADAESDSAGGLLAAILATAVSIAGFAVYQSIADAAGWKISELPLSAATPVPPGDDMRELLAPTSEPDWTVRGTFERSDTLFAFLLLLIPVALLYGLRNRSLKARFALAAAVLIVAASLLAGNDFLRSSFPSRLKNGWTVAVRMVEERPLFGVGPGNFDRHAPRLLPESASHSISEAWGSYSEIAATCGIPALIAIAIALIWVLIAIAKKAMAPSPNPPLSPEDRLVRWEFFIGGAAGLVLGLLLRLIDLPGAEEAKTIRY
jgi:hypothetical protein